MQTVRRRVLTLIALVGVTPFLAACGLAHTSSRTAASVTPTPTLPGEGVGTIPASAARQPPPTRPAVSAPQAVARFAESYINWTYLSLAGEQARLAASAIGAARATELQAKAKTARDTPLRRAHIYNTGTIVAVSQVLGGRAGEWVVVTRERSGGDQEYAGIGASFHVTLASVQRVAGGFAVSAWRPQV